nr:translation initiation factor IF-2 [Anser cygnoides]XP_047913626.1 translation initiation factor IF-2 [Anser cygnoides]XP_047913627.1 translation initiation factor IF-2 [Anser cygnoides]XP_047913628.1 translation initiation factor IF-2 [Anser cygnoides]
MLPAAVRGPRADFTARNVLFWGRNNTTASKLFRRHLQPHQHGSAVVRSHLSDSPPAALLRLRGSVRPRKPRPRLPAPQPDPPEPPGPAERPGRGLARPRSGGRSPPGEGAGAEGGQRLRRGQSPARRGACAHPPAACGVFRTRRGKHRSRLLPPGSTDPLSHPRPLRSLRASFGRENPAPSRSPRRPGPWQKTKELLRTTAAEAEWEQLFALAGKEMSKPVAWTEL